MNLESALKSLIADGKVCPPAAKFLYGADFADSGELTDAFKNISAFLAEKGAVDFMPLGSGIESAVLSCGQYCVKISPDNVRHPNKPVLKEVLPSVEVVREGFGINFSELVDMGAVDLADVFVLGLKLREQNCVFWDPKTENIGRAKDGQVYIVDYGSYFDSSDPNRDFRNRFAEFLVNLTPSDRENLAQQITEHYGPLRTEDREFILNKTTPSGCLTASKQNKL